MGDEIEIPESASRPKFFPPDFDRERISREIKEDIALHGTPLKCRHHTHTKAPKGAPVEYIGYIEHLPMSCSGHENKDRWSPCACCSLTHPKFYKDMIIVYFLEEGVIRCIGKYCFRRHNPELHAAAWKAYRKEQERRSNLSYLIAQLHKIPIVIAITESNLDIVRAVDAFRAELAKLLDKIYSDDVWKHVRSGTLYLTTQHTAATVNREGQETQDRDMTVQSAYGRIAGYGMLDPNRKRLAGRLEQDLVALQAIAEKPLDTMSDQDRAQAVKLFSQTYRHSVAVYRLVEELRQFTTKVELGTLNGWSNTVGAPIKMFVAFDGITFSMGRSPNAMVQMKVREAYNHVLRQLPSIAETAIAAEPSEAVEAAE